MLIPRSTQWLLLRGGDGDDNDDVDTYLGVGCAPVSALGEVSGLSRHLISIRENADLATEEASVLVEEASQALNMLEIELSSWQPPLNVQDEALPVLAETYRSAAILCLYRTLRYHGLRNADELEPDIEEHTSHIVQCISRLPAGCLPECTLLFPLFIAGGESRNADHQQVIEDRMHAIFQNRSFANVEIALDVLKEVWDVQARTLPVDPARPKLQTRPMDTSHILERSMLKVALIQMRPVPLEPITNFATAAAHIRAAASRGASLAVLPEYHLTGWLPDDARFREIAARSDKFLHQYQRLAEECNIHIVPGTIVTLASNAGTGSDEFLLNKTYFISSNGKILGEYTKCNLWHPERTHLTSGPDFHLASMEQGAASIEHHSVVETPIGPIGLLICYDFAFPESFRALVRAGAKLIIIPTYTKCDDMSEKARFYNPSGEELFVRSALISRAFENTCCIVFCNVGGPKEEEFMGLSQVVLPIVGQVPGGFQDSQEGLRVVGVDLGALEAAEENYKIRRDLAKTGFHYS
ncbi:hypothetical protein PRZ48_014828 [Zasmidium cellare]|uniref:CN hydrolase domain-containing protein n=1 Tax=Zasmidium cellare TaxID=395010 RepID=A0ABR0DXB0_ZASCE|nr:hypothetical protein PRZ48_014828 [Zasmidium cellare]